MNKILSIDYGIINTGLAITDSYQLIASGLDVVKTNNLINYLDILFKKEKISIIVIGLPITLKNKFSYIEKKINILILKIKNKYFNIKIKRIDERFTSKIAFEHVIKKNFKKKIKNKKLIDIISATIILQSYLYYIN